MEIKYTYKIEKIKEPEEIEAFLMGWNSEIPYKVTEISNTNHQEEFYISIEQDASVHSKFFPSIRKKAQRRVMEWLKKNYPELLL